MTLIDLTTPAAPRPAHRRPARSRSSEPARSGWRPPPISSSAGIDFVIYEAGDTVASSMRSWGHIRLFSPWKHLIDPAARRLLEASGWSEPRYRDSAPSGAELVDQYLAPLARLDADRIQHPHRGDGGGRDATGHGPHPLRQASRNPVRPPRHRPARHRLGGDGAGRHRRLGHLSHTEQPRVERPRPSRRRGCCEPRDARAARRAHRRARSGSRASTSPSSERGTPRPTRSSTSGRSSRRSPTRRSRGRSGTGTRCASSPQRMTSCRADRRSARRCRS